MAEISKAELEKINKALLAKQAKEDEETAKNTQEKHGELKAVGSLKVVKTSEAHVKAETVPGIHAGKVAKFSKPEPVKAKK